MRGCGNNVSLNSVVSRAELNYGDTITNIRSRRDRKSVHCQYVGGRSTIRCCRNNAMIHSTASKKELKCEDRTSPNTEE
jgi:hypothetical protein